MGRHGGMAPLVKEYGERIEDIYNRGDRRANWRPFLCLVSRVIGTQHPPRSGSRCHPRRLQLEATQVPESYSTQDVLSNRRRRAPNQGNRLALVYPFHSMGLQFTKVYSKFDQREWFGVMPRLGRPSLRQVGEP